MTESERVDSVRYALREAIEIHLKRCGTDVSFYGIPDEVVADRFLDALGELGFVVVQDQGYEKDGRE